MKRAHAFALLVLGIINVFSSDCSAQLPMDASMQGGDAIRAMHDNRAWVDLKSAATSEEAYYVDNEKYISCANEKCQAVLPGLLLSPGVALKMEAVGAGFRGEASHKDGSGMVFHYDSVKGGMQEKAPMHR